MNPEMNPELPIEYWEWRQRYGQQALDEGWMLYVMTLRSGALTASFYSGKFNPELWPYLERRAKVDKDPAAIQAIRVYENICIVGKLSGGDEDYDF